LCSLVRCPLSALLALCVGETEIAEVLGDGVVATVVTDPDLQALISSHHGTGVSRVDVDDADLLADGDMQGELMLGIVGRMMASGGGGGSWRR